MDTDRVDGIVSRAEVLTFLRSRLDIGDAEELLRTNKPQLLRLLSLRWMQTIPFTTLKQLSTPLPRTCPSPRQACDDVMSGLGGLCGTHGVAMLYMLRALQFDSHALIARVGDVENHVLVLVCDLEATGDAFIVEVGVGYPSFHLTQIKHASADFIDCTQQVSESFVTYKYKRVSCSDTPATYERLHLLTSQNQDALGRPYSKIREQNWGVLLTFQVQPVSLAYVYSRLNEYVYNNPDDKFNHIALAYKYPASRAVMLRNTVLVLEDEDGKLDSRKVKDESEMRHFVQEHFPEIHSSIVDAALKFWKSLR